MDNGFVSWKYNFSVLSKQQKTNFTFRYFYIFFIILSWIGLIYLLLPYF